MFTTIFSRTEATKEMESSNILSVKLKASANLYINKGEFSVRIEGNQNDISDLLIFEKKGVLTIDQKDKKVRNSGIKKVNIYLQMPHIKSLCSYGAGDILVMDEFICEELLLKNIGNGDIIFTKASKSNHLRIHLVGNGDINTTSVDALNVSTYCTGNGDIYLSAKESLKAIVIGNGSVYYKGNIQPNTFIIGNGCVDKVTLTMAAAIKCI